MAIIDDEKLDGFAKAFTVQKDQLCRAQQVTGAAFTAVDELLTMEHAQLSELDALLAQAEALAADMGIDPEQVSVETEGGQALALFSDIETDSSCAPVFERIDTVDTGANWDEYAANVQAYADAHGIDLDGELFQDLLTQNERRQLAERIKHDYLAEKPNCDSLDYALAGLSGLLCGLVDVLFVKAIPGGSALSKWTDKQTDSFVMQISQRFWNSKQKKLGKAYGPDARGYPDTLPKAIAWLEKMFPVNYDAENASRLTGAEGKLDMGTRNHHFKSLAHSPDLIGLLFSLMDQFAGEASFAQAGKVMKFTPVAGDAAERCVLQGETIPQKIVAGTVNWIGHLLSDAAGSSGKKLRGSGLSAPLTELFQLSNIPLTKTNGTKDQMTIATLAVDLYQNGYDLRFAEACAIPVVLNELLTSLFWGLEQHFKAGKPWDECGSALLKGTAKKPPELRRMLCTSSGVMVLIDAGEIAFEALINGEKDITALAMHANLAVWEQFGIAAYTEIQCHYRENVMDINAVERDLDAEWRRLAETPAGWFTPSK